ncbi:Conserved_hypothetical protein [Hexamita inflata]|uniref:Uncharacterized protein n=1 Tax=Hexamita inflata TaxID=28002 RepID=A0AA86UXF9_9EUKA|nr:Conserved hypothetical protein [Hexamita inflata]
MTQRTERTRAPQTERKEYKKTSATETRPKRTEGEQRSHEFKPRFEVPEKHKGDVSKMHKLLSDMGYHFSFYDVFTALQDMSFSFDDTIMYVTSDRFKPWKVESNKKFGHHEEQHQKHRSGYSRKVNLQFFEEEPEIVIDTTPMLEEVHIAIQEPVVIQIEEPKAEKPKAEPKPKREPKAKTEKPKAEPKVEKPVIEEIHIEEIVVKVEEPKEVVKAEKPKAEKKPKVEKKAEIKVEEPKVEAVKVEEPKIEVQAAVQQPQMQMYQMPMQMPYGMMPMQGQMPMGMPGQMPMGMPYGMPMPMGMPMQGMPMPMPMQGMPMPMQGMPMQGAPGMPYCMYFMPPQPQQK